MIKSLAAAISATVAHKAEAAARDAARRIFLVLLAALLMTVVFVFVELALFLWLRTQMPSYLAALVVALVALVCAFIALLAASRGGSASSSSMGAPPRNTDASGSGDGADQASETLQRLVEDAEAVGKTFAKDAGPTQLVLSAFLVGMLLGRGR